MWLVCAGPETSTPGGGMGTGDRLDNSTLGILGLFYVKEKQVNGAVPGEGHQIQGRYL